MEKSQVSGDDKKTRARISRVKGQAKEDAHSNNGEKTSVGLQQQAGNRAVQPVHVITAEVHQ